MGNCEREARREERREGKEARREERRERKVGRVEEEEEEEEEEREEREASPTCVSLLIASAFLTFSMSSVCWSFFSCSSYSLNCASHTIVVTSYIIMYRHFQSHFTLCGYVSVLLYSCRTFALVQFIAVTC